MSILEKQTMDAGHLVWCAVEHCYTHILGFPGRPSCRTAQGLWPQNCCSQQLHSLWCRSFRPTDMSHLRCCHIGSTGWQNLHRYTESILSHLYGKTCTGTQNQYYVTPTWQNLDRYTKWILCHTYINLFYFFVALIITIQLQDPKHTLKRMLI